MKDQVSRLTSLGMSAISLSDIITDSQRKAVENGEYSIVYGSPESWLGDERWRKMVARDGFKRFVRALAVDEAHIISHWYVIQLIDFDFFLVSSSSLGD